MPSNRALHDTTPMRDAHDTPPSRAGPVEAAWAPSRAPFDGVRRDLVESALERILASATFRRSERHRAFLRHVVNATLEGRHAELKEIVIRLEVFGRPLAVFDPRDDPIVRVEAGRVRDKLARYYAVEGADDPFELQIPIGGYLPQMLPRPGVPGARPRAGALAVLPIASLSSDADDAVFCSALANQLIDVLARVPGLRVIGRLSAAKARAQESSYRTLGKLIGVDSVIEGSVQRSGSRYRCLVRQLRTHDGLCLWSQRFEGRFDERIDHFALQDEISDAVLAAVQRKDVAPVAHAATRPSTPNSEARDLFARGRYLAQRFEIDDHRKAIALLERAVELEAAFGPAYSQLAACQASLAMLVAAPSKAAFDEVERNAQRALALDPLDGDARAILANIAFRLRHDWPGAERMFVEALRVAPNSTRAHSSFGGSLVYCGRYVEGVQHVRIALDLDPLNVSLRGDYALTCAFARDFATAVQEFEAILELEPDHLFSRVMLGMTQVWRGDPTAALPHFERVAQVAPNHPVPGFCRVVYLGATGAIDEGQRFLAAHVERIGSAPYARFNRAMAEAYLGDRAAMATSLRVASAANEVLFVTLGVDPTFDRYRDDPGFTQLLHGHGLPVLQRSPYLDAVDRDR